MRREPTSLEEDLIQLRRWILFHCEPQLTETELLEILDWLNRVEISIEAFLQQKGDPLRQEIPLHPQDRHLNS